MVSLKINGVVRNIDAPDDMPLLWALRDVLNMTGTKYGCGAGDCGACTVLVNNDSARACQTPIGSLTDAEVITIEGLSTDNSHPLQKAWIEVGVPQCGYCQAGQIMSAAALLIANPKPTDADIDEAMRHNICRCGTYTNIREAIHRASVG
ncbi:MAG: (2Fe-2S)-binding protein [Candidatus Kapaibacterium sp.]|nr:(2Fe-2S)-binding protein [Bacteroidota bacterium]